MPEGGHVANVNKGNVGTHTDAGPGMAGMKLNDFSKTAGEVDGPIGDRIDKPAVNLPNGAVYQGQWLGEMRDGVGH